MGTGVGELPGTYSLCFACTTAPLELQTMAPEEGF